MARRETGGYDSRHVAGVGVMQDLPTSAQRSSVSARYRLGGTVSKDFPSGRDRIEEIVRGPESLEEQRVFKIRCSRDRMESQSFSDLNRSSMCKDCTSKKFEWEHLMAGQQNGNEYDKLRRSVIEEHQADRFGEFKVMEDVFQENMSSDIERERWLLHPCLAVGKPVSSKLVGRRPTKNDNAGLCDIGTMQTEGQQEDEITRGEKYLHEEDRHIFFSDKGPCHTGPSPSHYRFPRPPSSGNLIEAGEKPLAEKIEIGKYFEEDIGPCFESNYIPLSMSPPYQPQSRSPSFCISKPSEYREQMSMKENYAEEKTKSGKCFVGEEGAVISSDNGLPYVISSPYLSRYNAGRPLSTGNESEDREYTLHATQNIAKRKYFHKDDASMIHSDYGHRYIMPSPQSKSKTLTPQSMVCASPDRDQALTSKQAAALRTGRKEYFNEDDGPRLLNDGFRHVMLSPPELESKTLPIMSVSHARDHVAKSFAGPLPKPQHESSMRLKELHLYGINQDDCAPCCQKEAYCSDQNCFHVEEGVRSLCTLSSLDLPRKMSKSLEDYDPRDRLWVNVMGGADGYGNSREHKLKSCKLRRHHRSSQELDFHIHSHDSIAPRHLVQNLEAISQNMSPHEVKTKAHYLEERKNETYEVQPNKFAQLDDDHDFFKDEDFYIDITQSNIMKPGYFHNTSYSDCSLQGNTRALLRGRYGQDNSFTIDKTYCNNQDDGYEQLGERDDEIEYHSRRDAQCQMLIRRSAHIQNKDITGVGDEALDNTIDFDCPLPFEKLPLRMQKRLGKPTDSAIRGIKKRLRSGPQITDFGLSKKNKLSNSEHHQGHSSNPSMCKVISRMGKFDEDSEKFKEHVHHAFLEFAKHLFESSAQQRKYMELEKYESLRCSICGSSSREFKDTRSLAKHAFSYVNMPTRAQHLGLHKALCVLMGWNSFVAPNNPISHLMLPESEHLALKEDLIIWPPVVIVHNSSVRNKDLPKQKIITIGKLESVLEGEGFGRNNYKLHLGNDQGIIVVRFSATLSGLQAAEELHILYAKNKHGRAEFEHIAPNGGCDSSEESHNSTQDILYGYFGIVEDLPKLDSQIKKWTFIKSRKKLLAANSPQCTLTPGA